MSVLILTLVFKHSRSRGSARLVLLALADVAADTGEVTAYKRSQSILASKANVDAGTVRRSIEKLVELGEVEVLTRGDGRRSSDYRILVGPPAGEGVQAAPPPDATPGGAGCTPSPGKTRAQGGQAAPPIITSLPVGDPSPSVAAAPATKKHLLPGDFVVTDAMRAWAAEKTPTVDVDEQLERFRDHWVSKAEKRADWPATWRNWMRNATSFGGTARRPGPRPRPAPPLAPRLDLDSPKAGRVQL